MRALCFALAPVVCCALFAQQKPADPVTVREAGQLPTPDSLTIPALGKIHVPKPTVFSLSNGMKIYMLEDHELPVVRGNHAGAHRKSVRSGLEAGAGLTYWHHHA